MSVLPYSRGQCGALNLYQNSPILTEEEFSRDQTAVEFENRRFIAAKSNSIKVHFQNFERLKLQHYVRLKKCVHCVWGADFYIA